MYALGPAALGLWAYISGKSLMPMLQLLLVSHPHPKQKVETSESRSEEIELEETIRANYKN